MKKVKGYTLSYCPWCKKTKKFFADHGIEFEYVDYDLADAATQKKIDAEIQKHSGGGVEFPCVIIDDKFIVGYAPDKYKELLKIQE